MSADSAFHMASVSKPVTATAMMQLQEVGLYHLDDPIGPHLTPIPTSTDVSFQQGLVWEIRGMGDDLIVEKAGIDPGTTALVSVKSKKGTEALVFANILRLGHKEVGRFMREVVERLHDKALST